MLREGDKKPGWSLNTKSGHKQEYYRHLTTDFYQRFESVEDVNLAKENMQAFFFVRHLTREDFPSFNLGANLDDYTLPSLNLIPKVHKLTEKAGVAMEPFLGTLFPSKVTK